MPMNIEHLAAQKAPETLKNFIAGRWVASSSNESLVVPNPATEQILAHVPLSNAADVAAAVAGARAAAFEWGEMPPPERATYLFKLREALLDNREALTKLVTTENGKVFSDAAGEVRRGIEVVDFACGAPTLLMGQNLDQVSRGIDSEMVRFPVGVVAGITPFNFPFMVPMWMLPLAIACGNSFILKPSERTPLSSQRIVEICEEAGIPTGVVSLVHGGVETVTGLISHPGVDAISFVGSERVARIVYETAAKNGKRVQALGGAKNHIIAMPDAVLEQSVPNIAESAFGNAGQRCLAGSVLTVVGEARELLLPKLVEHAETIKMGFGLDEGVSLGPVIRGDARERIHRLVDEGVAAGAKMIRDGRGTGPAKGFFVGPTLISIEENSPLAREEVFGPVLSVLYAKDLDEALRLMAETNEYGNAGSIYTASGKAAREFKRRATSGMLGVNVGVAAPMAFFPFSGRRKSFFGDLHATGRDGVEFYTTKKVITTRWF
jgi:malonate-semialdehyde dehydrogenase (acetylating)/methylmalonate-semialdehyde dehydrogenase